ncbi:MAG: hypothetical protein ACQKHC_00555 [Candidatus Phytoplasma pruni]
MTNKSFKQNLIIKYTSILLLNLILVLSMGVTNIFGHAQDINTMVTGELGEQAAELTKDTAEEEVKKKYPNLIIDEVTVTVDTAEQKVTVKANDNSTVYTGTATVQYTVKASSELETSGPREIENDKTEDKVGTPRTQVQENNQVDINTMVTGELGEQAAELTKDTAEEEVKKKYPNLIIDEVTVTVDTAEQKVTVKANDNSTVYTGTATVQYTVKASSELETSGPREIENDKTEDKVGTPGHKFKKTIK